jgi:hypothetical protein
VAPGLREVRPYQTFYQTSDWQVFQFSSYGVRGAWTSFGPSFYMASEKAQRDVEFRTLGHSGLTWWLRSAWAGFWTLYDDGLRGTLGFAKTQKRAKPGF